MILEKIKERNKIRAEISDAGKCRNSEIALLLISDSIDDYIEHRINTDKVLEGILMHIDDNIANITQNGIAIDNRER